MSIIDDLKNEIYDLKNDIFRLQKHFNETEEEMLFWRRALYDARDKLAYLNSQLEAELDNKLEDEDE